MMGALRRSRDVHELLWYMLADLHKKTGAPVGMRRSKIRCRIRRAWMPYGQGCSNETKRSSKSLTLTALSPFKSAGQVFSMSDA